MLVPRKINLLEPLRSLPQISAALSHDGRLLGQLFVERRLNCSFDELSSPIISAVLSAEDKRFWHHKGVDVPAVARAIFKNVKNGRFVQGGSTLTQQLVRNVVLHDRRKVLRRKLREMIISLILERMTNKKEIFECYLNSAYFGHGIYGVRLASIEYFGKDIGSLNVEEAACLAGMLKGPAHYCICCKRERSERRTRWVISKMLENKHQTSNMDIRTTRRYFRRRKSLSDLCPSTAPYFLNYTSEWLSRTCRQHFPKSRLVVRTSLDINCQLILEEVCRSVATQCNGRVACIIQDATTGLVRAIAGGTDYRKFPFNAAVNGKLQPGSTLKPFITAAAIKKGIGVNTAFFSQPLEIIISRKKKWRVSNFRDNYRGEMTIAEALITSDNSVFAQLVAELDLGALGAFLKRVGLPIKVPTAAIAVGAVSPGLSPLNVCSSYSIFSCEGMYFEPSPAIEVRTEAGETVATHSRNIIPALDMQTSEKVRLLLSDVVRRGTGLLAGNSNGIHAKTGTTRDGSWYVSFDSAFRVLTWVETDPEDPVKYSDKAVTARVLAARIWDLIRKGGYASTKLYGVFRGMDSLTVKDMLWLEDEFA